MTTQHRYMYRYVYIYKVLYKYVTNIKNDVMKHVK
jgi:hypothetical protein